VWSGHSCPLLLTLILILTWMLIRIRIYAFRHIARILGLERARLQPRRHAHKPTTACHSDHNRTPREAEGDGAGRNLLSSSRDGPCGADTPAGCLALIPETALAARIKQPDFPWAVHKEPHGRRIHSGKPKDGHWTRCGFSEMPEIPRASDDMQRLLALNTPSA